MVKIEGIGRYSGTVSIMIELLKHPGGIMFTKLQSNLDMGPNTVYKATGYLIKHYVVEEIREHNFRLLKLTDIGRRCAEKLKEANDIWNE